MYVQNDLRFWLLSGLSMTEILLYIITKKYKLQKEIKINRELNYTV